MKKLITITALAIVAACKEPGAPTTQQEAAVGYQADLLNCTKNSASLAESKACEGMVDIRWHVVDGGVAK